MVEPGIFLSDAPTPSTFLNLQFIRHQELLKNLLWLKPLGSTQKYLIARLKSHREKGLCLCAMSDEVSYAGGS